MRLKDFEWQTVVDPGDPDLHCCSDLSVKIFRLFFVGSTTNMHISKANMHDMILAIKCHLLTI